MRSHSSRSVTKGNNRNEFFHTRKNSCNADNKQPLNIVLLIQHLFCLLLCSQEQLWCSQEPALLDFWTRRESRSIFHAPICSQIFTCVSSWGILWSSAKMNVLDVSCTSFQVLHIIYMQFHNAIIFLRYCGYLKYVELLIWGQNFSLNLNAVCFLKIKFFPCAPVLRLKLHALFQPQIDHGHYCCASMNCDGHPSLPA